MKKLHRKMMPSRGPRGLIIALGIVLLGVGLLSWLISSNREVVSLTYSQFLDKVERGEVDQVRILGQEVEGLTKDGIRFEVDYCQKHRHNWDVLRNHGVNTNVQSSAGQYNFWYVLLLTST